MAEQSSQHVVNQAQSMGDHSPIDVSGTLHSSNATGGGVREAAEKFEDTTVSDAHTIINSENTASSDVKSISISEKEETMEDSNVRGIIKTLNPQADNGQTISKSVEQTKDATDSRENLVNGDSGSYDGSDDTGYQHSASEDVTDPAKVEGTEQNIDASTGQERASSIKKPVSFKPVSVTKNFLAKTGTAATAAAKPPVDKVSPSIQSLAAAAPQGPKPRLVAKSGRDTRSTSLRVGGTSGGGPDASKVWNRNKPAPAPVPKQFTDEELKQQYGIHLATRLQADESGKDPKWADIDDDEDDWAPETVEWMDGTKSTIAPTDSQPGQPLDAAGEAVKMSEDAAKDLAAASRLSAISSVGKTILRPGARLISQTKPGLVLKSVPENQLASEKPSTPAAAKSPWAQLPPIDKASPINFQPPATPSPRPAPALPREQPPPDGPGRIPSPAREIAADDFNRSWREGERSSRELFNSQSGRYEPVKAPPRKTTRQDSGVRAPALLQRPSQQGQVGESSVSFQSSRSSHEQDGKLWPRSRRDSSSLGERSASERVSEQGGEMSRDARTSPSQPHKEIHRTDSPATSQLDRVNSPNPSSVDSVAPAGAPSSYHARGGERSQAPSAESSSAQDVRAVQQQLMKEKIELNRKRKQEEEAKEEAARKERIRIRMEALGPPVMPAKETPTEEKPLSQDSIALKTQSVSQPSTKDSEKERILIPSAEKSIEPVSAAVPVTVSPSETQDLKHSIMSPPASEPSTLSRPHLIPARSPKFGAPQPSKALSDTNIADMGPSEVQQLPGLGQAPPPDRAVQSWTNITQGADHSMSWGNTNNRAMNAGNVWGPLSHDRPLGNGAFASEFKRIPPLQRQHHQAGLQHPAPSSLPQRPSSMSPSIPFDNASIMANQPIARPHTEHQPQAQVPVSPPMSTHPFSQSGAILPKPAGRGMQRSSDQVQAAKSRWNNFANNAKQEDAAILEKQRAKAEKNEYGVSFVQTFVKTGAMDNSRNRQVFTSSTDVHTISTDVRDVKADTLDKHDATDASPNMPVGAVSAPQATPQGIIAQPAVNGRASRFFGPGVDRGNALPVAPPPVVETNSPENVALEPVSWRPASPPPPDSPDHPAYGPTSHPLIRLPTPAPKVKLPPMSSPSPVDVEPSSPQEPVIMPSRYRTGPQPIVNQADWQDRFNGLFGRAARPQRSGPSKDSALPTVHSPGQQVATVEISSKAAFDAAFVPESTTTVSLPQGLDLTRELRIQISFASLPDDYIESKPTEDDLMDEEREFGSSPTVKLPHAEYGHAEAMQLAPSPRFISRFANMETAGEFVSSIQPISFDDLDSDQKLPHGILITIRIHGRDYETQMLHSNIQLDTTRRPSKASHPKKRTLAGKRGGSINSQSPQSATPRSETGLTDQSSPQPDAERRGGWPKAHKPAKGPKSVNSTVSNEQSLLTASSSASKPQPEAPTVVAPAVKPQGSGYQRTVWAKPPRGPPRGRPAF